MPKRPVFHPELGAKLTGLRTARDWSQSDAARFAAGRGLKALTRQVLLRLETGKTKWLDPAVLRDLAELYGLAYDELVSEVVEHEYGLKVAKSSPAVAVDGHDAGRPAGVPKQSEPGGVHAGTIGALSDRADSEQQLRRALKIIGRWAMAVAAGRADVGQLAALEAAGAAHRRPRRRTR